MHLSGSGGATSVEREGIAYDKVRWPWQTNPEFRRKRIEVLKKLRLYGWDPKPDPNLKRRNVTFEHRVTDALLKETLRYLPEIRELSLVISDVSAEGLKETLRLKYLQSLQLRDDAYDDKATADISAQGMEHVGQHVGLQRLAFVGVQVTDEEFEHLGGLRNMRSLHLNATNVTPRCFRTIAKWPKIENISIYYQEFKEPVDAATHQAIASLNGPLKTLEFDEFGAPKLHPSMIRAIAEIKSLTWLELGDTQHLTLEELSPLKQLTNLKHFQGEVHRIERVWEAFARARATKDGKQ